MADELMWRPGATSLQWPEHALVGEMLRPPHLGWGGQGFIGPRLQPVNLDAVRQMPGVVCAVSWAACAGVVAVSAAHARQALEQLGATGVTWERPVRRGAPPATQDRPNAYTWTPVRAASAEETHVTVWCHDSGATVWAAAVDGRACQEELALLTGLPVEAIRVVQPPSAGPVRHTLAVIDAAADAALLSRAARAPVRVRVGTVQALPPVVIGVAAGSGAGGQAPHAATPWTLEVPGPWAPRPSLARLLSQPGHAPARAALPLATPYRGIGLQVVGQGLDSGAGPARAPLSDHTTWDLLAAQTFALESQFDERARAAGLDPVDDRLARLPAGPARALVADVAARAGWSGEPPAAGDPRLRGRGFAFAEDNTAPDSTAWSAWVAEVAVDPLSGRIDLTRVVVGHDSQQRTPAQVPGIVADSAPLLAAARRLLEPPPAPGFDTWGTPVPVAADHALIAASPPAASLEPVRSAHLQVDGVLTLPAAAAIANAVYDATGVRLRHAPFDSAELQAALRGSGAASPTVPAPPGWARSRALAWLAGAAATAAGAVAMAWPAKPALPLIESPDLSVYSAASLERGRLVAAAGDCVACHTAPGGAPNAGGLALDTPFGTIYTTNITPDKDSGIGRWSFAAFDRAMRQGVHQDGRQLYPAFPYTAFAKMSEGDMQALYGYLMSQPPVPSVVPPTELAFPYRLRPMMSGWNTLFHDASPYVPDPTQSVEWNRGAYLVQGVGHCGACHTPRNALGAEKSGPAHFLAGADVEGWHAPALNALGSGAVPWSAEELFQYLRHGYSARHGVAAGPMGPVIHGLAQVPESDVRAIATYLMALGPQAAPRAEAGRVEDPRAPAERAVRADTAPSTPPAAVARAAAAWPINGERIYQNACAVCHESRQGPTLFGVKPDLARNTNLHLARPDNLIQVILNGIPAPASGELGYMPGFKDHFDDHQVAELLAYLQARYAPSRPRWDGVAERAAQLRASGGP